jgi:hypothetical protein
MLKKFFYKGFTILLIASLAQSCNNCSGTNQNNTTDNLKNECLLIVLNHGIGGKASDLEPWENKLEKESFGIPTIIISVDRPDSKTSPLATQAKNIVDNIKAEMKNKRLNIKNTKVLPIGDSQGGLILLSVYQQKEDLNIIGIITNHSPLDGAPGTAPSLAQTTQIDDILNLLNLPGLNFQTIMDKILGTGPGIKDMSPTDSFIKTIRDLPIPIPILALSGDIGGQKATEILAFLDPTLNTIKQKANTLFPGTFDRIAILIDDIIGADNDGLVPKESQEGKNQKNKPNLRAYSVPGYHHFADLTTTTAYPKMVSFIKQVTK